MSRAARPAGAGSHFPRARKRFGQHFLEPAWVAKLIERVAPSPGDVFLEIGPGRGALTKPLAPRVGRIVAVEIDRDLAAALPSQVPAHVRVVQGDFLEADVDLLLQDAAKPVRVIGNLPYNVSSPILFKLLATADEGRTFSDATLMVQKEVADRLAASPGTSHYGSLAIQVALTADVDRLLTLPAGAFRPPPKVTSSVVRLRFRAARVDVADRVVFDRLVRGLFQRRRKTVLNALKPLLTESSGRSAGEIIARARLNPSQRPETLTLEDVARLAGAVL